MPKDCGPTFLFLLSFVIAMILVVQSTLTMLVDEEVNLKGSLALHPALHVEDSPQPSRQSACTFFFVFLSCMAC